MTTDETLAALARKPMTAKQLAALFKVSKVRAYEVLDEIQDRLEFVMFRQGKTGSKAKLYRVRGSE